MTNRSRNILFMIGGALFLALIAGGIYGYGTRTPQTEATQQPSSSTPEVVVPEFDMPAAAAATSSASSAPRTPPAGFLEYRNTEYGFSFFYPSDLAVSVSDDGGGASTVVFQSTQNVQGFQIFIVPYQGTQVSEQRFKEDEPSGVRNGVTTGLISGAPAAAFYSTDVRLGDTYEVWFIHGGYLYEATTLKPLDTWFQSIMQTWEFI